MRLDLAGRQNRTLSVPANVRHPHPWTKTPDLEVCLAFVRDRCTVNGMFSEVNGKINSLGKDLEPKSEKKVRMNLQIGRFCPQVQHENE